MSRCVYKKYVFGMRGWFVGGESQWPHVKHSVRLDAVGIRRCVAVPHPRHGHIVYLSVCVYFILCRCAALCPCGWFLRWQIPWVRWIMRPNRSPMWRGLLSPAVNYSHTHINWYSLAAQCIHRCAGTQPLSVTIVCKQHRIRWKLQIWER